MKLYRLPNRQVLRLHGDAALSYLQDVSTADVAVLMPGSGALTAFLTDKGKLRGIARAFVVSTAEVLLDGEGDQRLDHVLGPYAPLAGIEVEVEEWVGLRVTGGDETLAAEGMLPPERPYATSWWGDVLCVRGGWGDVGIDLLCHHLQGPEKILLEAGGDWGDPLEIEETRIAAGLPRFGVDVGEDTHINETPLLEHAVSFTKGCYPGQESVARIRNLGRVKRSLRVLEVAEPVRAGDEVLSGSASIGRITSAHGKFALAWIAAGAEESQVNVGDPPVAARLRDA